MEKTPFEQTCTDCGHSRQQHSRAGCLNRGMCEYGCKVKFTDKDKFR